MQLSMVDLFCGAGGMSAGFTEAGINVVAAFDNWNAALQTYRRNLFEHTHELDLSNVDSVCKTVKDFDADIISGGPPCQDFSTAGKRVEGERADLTKTFAEIVVRVLPKFFVMENVPRVRLSQSYRKSKVLFENAGYKVSEVILDASLCDAPQARKRFFAFGTTDHDTNEEFLRSLNSRISIFKMSVKDYLKNEIDIDHYYRHPRNYSRRSVFSVHEPSPTIRGVNRPVPPGYTGNHLDAVSPSFVRPLTSSERSRIQTFPSTWNWNASDRNADVELQIGNAVPINLARFVAKGVLDAARSI